MDAVPAGESANVTSEACAEFFMRHSARGDAVCTDGLLLPNWRHEDWCKLIALMQPRAVRAGEFVVNRNAVDRSLYFVLSGEYEVGITRMAGIATRSIATIGAGSVIGDQSFFDGLPRSANVWAVSAGELLELKFRAYQQFAHAEAALAAELLFALGRVLSMRLRTTTLRAAG